MVSIKDLLEKRAGQNYELHSKHINPQIPKMLKMIGYDKVYVRAEGQYLYDQDDNKYLDLLSGFGATALGRNHPKMVEALKELLDLSLPNMVQLDCSLLAGLLAEKLIETSPIPFDRVFFCNSGAESVEGAIKFARAATKRSKILYCTNGFHGMTCGALSLNGNPYYRQGFGPMLSTVQEIPFDDLSALEWALRNKDVAGFVVEPVQGKGVNIPSSSYFPEVSRLCKKYGTLLIMDEVQTGIGRTGKFLASEHWNVEPDLVTLAKGLSGGFMPVAAIMGKKWVFDSVFTDMDRSMVHASTFQNNNLSMAAGIATLEIMREDAIIENTVKLGREFVERMKPFESRYEFVKEVRGLGLMVGIEFHPAERFALRAAWKLLEKANKGLFCQMVTIPLLTDHRILSQVGGPESYTVKFLPPLTLNKSDVDWAVDAADKVIEGTHKVPGAMLDLATRLTSHMMTSKKPRRRWSRQQVSA